MTNGTFQTYRNSLKNGLNEIKISNTFDKFFILFWIIGPFIYLIERSPADIWLSIISLTFIYRSFKNKETSSCVRCIKKFWKY